MTINENGVSREMTAEEIERYNANMVEESPSQVDQYNEIVKAE